MTARPHPTGWFTRLFRERYLGSLRDYRFFYDDLAEIGNPADAEHVFYFVPGINGTPGQIRFVLPSLNRVFGRRVYLKALYVPEFSAHRPTWEKYTLPNLDRKLHQLRSDLLELLDRSPRLTVIASSNGFYDFAAATAEFPARDLDRLHVVWGACAPDHFEPTPWEKVFFPLNGFEHQGHRWFAVPNHDAFQFLNPEVSRSHFWQDGRQRRRFLKADLESRFHLGGLEWDYLSVSQLAAAVRHVVGQIRRPLHCPAEALVAANDGYWQGKPKAEIERHVLSYLPNCHLMFKPTSHLWVVTPSHVTELLQRLQNRQRSGRQGSGEFTTSAWKSCGTEVS